MILTITVAVITTGIYLFWPKDTNAVGEIKTALFDNY